MTRKQRIDQLKLILEQNPDYLKNPILRRRVMEKFALEHGLRVQTVEDYVNLLLNTR